MNKFVDLVISYGYSNINPGYRRWMAKAIGPLEGLFYCLHEFLSVYPPISLVILTLQNLNYFLSKKPHLFIQ